MFNYSIGTLTWRLDGVWEHQGKGYCSKLVGEILVSYSGFVLGMFNFEVNQSICSEKSKLFAIAFSHIAYRSLQVIYVTGRSKNGTGDFDSVSNSVSIRRKISQYSCGHYKIQTALTGLLSL